MKALLISSTMALALLSACNREKAANQPLTTEEVAKKMDSVKLEAGEWEATQEITDVKVTGLPPNVPADAMKQMIGQKTTVKHCVTPEQAAKPSAEFLAAQKDAKCEKSTMDMSGGTVSATMECAVPQQPGSKMKMVMNGTYLPDHYDLNMQMDTSGLPNGVAMVITMKTSGKHIGACPAGGESAQ